ncbi:MAG: RNA 2',3'-cyclic phosphodiesterase [Terriglobia bacterium]|jgi:2'-5' RNA ligase
MRAFIAFDLPEPLHAALAEAQQVFRSACRDARWARPEGIHLTLKFLGEISDAQTKQVVEALAQIGPFEPFSVEVRGFGFFPQAPRPRVFWAGVVARPALTELAARVESRMEKAGFAREDRPFAPHLTLARFQVPRPQPALEAAVAGRTSTSLGQFEASEFFLFESKLSPQGAQYRKVMRFPRS